MQRADDRSAGGLSTAADSGDQASAPEDRKQYDWIYGTRTGGPGRIRMPFDPVRVGC